MKTSERREEMAGFGMRIAIVDDEVSVRETLKGYIERMSKEKGQEMNVFSFPGLEWFPLIDRLAVSL